MTSLTRRQTTTLLLAAATMPGFASIAQAETAETLAQKLGAALNGRLKQGCNGQFSLVRFALEGTRSNVVMRSSVRLSWPPGMRIRSFRSTGTSQQEAIVAMFQDALGEFNTAWPDCVHV